jgi:hypothetical protein
MRQLLNSITPEEREELANKCGTTVEYFWQIAGGHRKAGPVLAKKIQKHSSGRVKASVLRPDIFGDEDIDSAA